MPRPLQPRPVRIARTIRFSIRKLALLFSLLIFAVLENASAEAIYRTVTVAWDPSPSAGIVGYRLHYGTVHRQYSRVIEAADRTSADVPNLIDGTTYFFAVTAYNDLGEESLPSVEFTHTPGAATFLNMSTRALVQGGDDAMIAGFIVGGSSWKTIVVRALGPTLAWRGINNPLMNPALELYGADGMMIADNDSWRIGHGAAAQDFGLAPSHDAECAIVANLPPGSYTAVVRNPTGGAGIALLEVYDGGVPIMQ